MESTTEQFPTYAEIEAARERAAQEGGGSPEQQPDQARPENVVDRFEGAADDGALLHEGEGGQIALVVEGRQEKLSNAIEGRNPTSSTLRITGGKVEVGGQYQPGDRVSFLVTVVVDEVTVRDEKDNKTGQVVGRARNHKGAIVGIHEQGETAG
jgi:hypothetical protein